MMLWPICKKKDCKGKDCKIKNCAEKKWKSECNWSNCDWAVCDFRGVKQILPKKKKAKDVKIYLESLHADDLACYGTKADAIIIIITDKKYLICEIKKPMEPLSTTPKNDYLKRVRSYWHEKRKVELKKKLENSDKYKSMKQHEKANALKDLEEWENLKSKMKKNMKEFNILNKSLIENFTSFKDWVKKWELICALAIVIGGQLEKTFLERDVVLLADKVNRNIPSKIVSIKEHAKQNEKEKPKSIEEKRCLIFDKTWEVEATKAFDLLGVQFNKIKEYSVIKKLPNVCIWEFDKPSNDVLTKMGNSDGWYTVPPPKKKVKRNSKTTKG